MRLIYSAVLSAAIVFAYMYAFGGALFYEKIGSQKMGEISNHLTLQGRMSLFDNALASGINSSLQGRGTDPNDHMPDYIMDEGLIAIKVNDGYAGMYFPNEPTIDIPFFRYAYVFFGVILGALLIFIF